MTTKEKLERLLEDNLRKKIIIHLMKTFGCSCVRDWHGRNEGGIDVLYKKENTFGELVYRGILIKAVPINQTVLRTSVERQIKAAIDYSFPSPDHPRDKANIHELVVVTNKGITPEARSEINKLSRSHFPSIEIVDGDRLCGLIEGVISRYNKEQSKQRRPEFYNFGVNTFKMFCERYCNQMHPREIIAGDNITNVFEGGEAN